MPKVFLSTLGVTNYVECHYKLGDKVSTPTPYVQEALLELLCGDWSAKDRIFIFCSEDALQSNWQDRQDSLGLDQRIQNLHLACMATPVSIPEGKTEDEIMEIFKTVLDKIDYNDKILLDITHSFRSLPLLNAIVLNYAKVLKKTTVLGIYYGAFEVLGHPRKVENMPLEQRIAPIFDLTPYDVLLDWARAVDMFEQAGRAQHLKDLVNSLLEKNIPKKDGEDLKQWSDALLAMTQNISAVRGHELLFTNTAEKIHELTSQIESKVPLAALKPLLSRVRGKIEEFRTNDSVERGFAAVKWCLDHQLYPQAYILMQEIIITGICILDKLDYNDKDIRENIGKRLLEEKIEKRLNDDKWREQLKRLLRINDEDNQAFVKLAKEYNKLRKLRNDFMHAGFSLKGKKSAPISASRLETWAKDIFDNLRREWRNYSEMKRSRKSASTSKNDDRLG